jgi:hypothetical protein
MIDEKFSSESFISVGIDTDESRKLADLLAEEVANELHKIVTEKVAEIVEELNSMGHSLKPEYKPEIGNISFRDDFWKNVEYHCKLRLGIDTVISTGYSNLID